MKWVAQVARVARHCIAVTSGMKYIYHPLNNATGNGIYAYMCLLQKGVR